MGTKPILFNTENVRALLEGRKTNTRRVVKFKGGQNPAWSGYVPDGAVLYGSNNILAAKAPYQPGDILWVRETWRLTGVISAPYAYRADEKPLTLVGERGEILKVKYKWRSPYHMPREAARIFLSVSDVRVERLQDIRLKDCEREGVQLNFVESADLVMGPIRARERFSGVWDRTIKPADRPLYGWEANPWVWVIEFKRISKCGEDTQWALSR